MRQARATNPTELALRAEEVLRRNDMGEWTRAAPDLYPHQWSWDSGFIAIALAHLDTARAARELTGLFAHQWKNGKVPHIVFNPEAPPDSYFPVGERHRQLSPLRRGPRKRRGRRDAPVRAPGPQPRRRSRRASHRRGVRPLPVARRAHKACALRRGGDLRGAPL